MRNQKFVQTAECQNNSFHLSGSRPIGVIKIRNQFAKTPKVFSIKIMACTAESVVESAPFCSQIDLTVWFLYVLFQWECIFSYNCIGK